MATTVCPERRSVKVDAAAPLNSIPDLSFLSCGDFWWCYAIIDEFDVLDGTFHINDLFLRLIIIAMRVINDPLDVLSGSFHIKDPFLSLAIIGTRGIINEQLDFLGGRVPHQRSLLAPHQHCHRRH